MPFQQDRNQSVKLTPTEEGPILVDIVEEGNDKEAVESNASVRIKLFDMGGHTEYYACSSIFFSTSGLFLICFDSSLLKQIHVGDAYYRGVGTFVDLISQTSARSEIKLKIALVATKSETTESSEESQKKLLAVTAHHLVSLSAKVYLLNEVIMTSSKKVTRGILDHIRSHPWPSWGQWSWTTSTSSEVPSTPSLRGGSTPGSPPSD